MRFNVNVINYVLFEMKNPVNERAQAMGVSNTSLWTYTSKRSKVSNISLNKIIKIVNYFNTLLVEYRDKFGSIVKDGKEYIVVEGLYTPNKEEKENYYVEAIDSEGYKYIISRKGSEEPKIIPIKDKGTDDNNNVVIDLNVINHVIYEMKETNIAKRGV